MARRIQAKYKIDRRLGINLWGRPKSSFNKRNYAPGEHGKDRSKLSDYCIQLRAKQKLRGYYGALGEKQFKKIFAEALRRTGDTSENLIGLLERRLDAVVYRLKFAITIFAARQLVNHGHITVDGKKVNIPSYRVKAGSVIALKEESKEHKAALDALSKVLKRVEFVTFDDNKKEGTFVRLPERSELNPEINEALIVEFYNR